MCNPKWNQLSFVRRKRRWKADHGLDSYRELSRLSNDCMKRKEGWVSRRFERGTCWLLYHELAPICWLLSNKSWHYLNRMSSISYSHLKKVIYLNDNWYNHLLKHYDEKNNCAWAWTLKLCWLQLRSPLPFFSGHFSGVDLLRNSLRKSLFVLFFFFCFLRRLFFCSFVLIIIVIGTRPSTDNAIIHHPTLLPEIAN